MTNNEIDYQLAMAIGHQAQDVQKVAIGLGYVVVRCDKHNDGHGRSWWRFDHQNPSVILPIIERYDVYPYRLPNSSLDADSYCAVVRSDFTKTEVRHINPRTAAALAVIKAAERVRPCPKK